MITVHQVQSYVPVPTKGAWGEAWWTARDICLTNVPEPDLDDVMREVHLHLMEQIDTELWRSFIHGSS